LPANEKLFCGETDVCDTWVAIPRAPQETVGTSVVKLDFDDAEGQETVFIQDGYGQYFKFGFEATK
jgi:hypothetical protein